jgi:XTP/dITP diphosphohydrolase
MKELLFITSNKNKLKEVRSMIGGEYKILSLEDIEYLSEIPEPYDTITENSMHKAQYFYEEYGLACIAEDSGLLVEELNGKPGALSARYAGEERNDAKNIEKILVELNGSTNRAAKFISVFTFKDDRTEIQFEGEMRGTIIDMPRGENGFGYDPIFIADGYSKTNAELTMDEKNEISHRKKALKKFLNFIENYN